MLPAAAASGLYLVATNCSKVLDLGRQRPWSLIVLEHRTLAQLVRQLLYGFLLYLEIAFELHLLLLQLVNL